MTWAGYLDRDELRQVREALVEADLFAPEVFRVLLSALPKRYQALVPHNTNLAAAMRIDQTLRAMNSVVNLQGGEVPLKTVLAEASHNAADAGHRNLFDTMIDKIDARRPSSKVEAPAFTTAIGTPGAPIPMGGAQPIPMGAVNPTIATPPPSSSASTRLAAQLPDPSNFEISREAQIGDFDDTLSIDFLENGLRAATSVFKIVVHRHFDEEPIFNAGEVPDLSSGTAWVIKPGIGITNFHVFNARTDQEPQAEQADFNKQVVTARLIEDFRAEDDERQGTALGVDSLLYANKDLDFALFRLPAALAERPALALRRHPIRKNEVQKIGDRVNLLQHPMGRPMRLGFRNNFVVLGNNDILAYLTDTRRGSSGAPVLDDSWSVAALHVGSQKISVSGVKLLGVDILRENFGVPVKAILDHVEANAPHIFA